MLTIQYELAFKKDFKRMLKRGYNGALLEQEHIAIYFDVKTGVTGWHQFLI